MGATPEIDQQGARCPSRNFNYPGARDALSKAISLTDV